MDAVSYINALPKFTYPLGNEELSKLLALCENPEEHLKFIHIAGTNGKGSAAAMLGSILSEAGYRTGLFTSPYIISFNERIRIGNDEISDDELSFYTNKLKKLTLEHSIKISQFAFILAIAFCYYADKGCDAVVLEAGLGGRLDATNIIKKSLVSVIMSIGLDHTEYLGSTLAEIAREKGGIIKENGDAVIYSGQTDAVFEEICKKQRANLYIADSGFVGYQLSLGGDYQTKNASVVLKTVEVLRQKGFEISETALKNGFLKARHRGRFERVRDNIIVDGAHNPDGISALSEALESIKKEKTAIMAMMEDKAVEDALSSLSGFSKIIATEIDMPRCMKAESLAEKARALGYDVIVSTPSEKAFKMAEKCDFAVVCGSIYLAGEALKYFG